MPICKKCNAIFPSRLVIDGKIRNLGTRSFCLQCSPFREHNTRNLDALKIATSEYKTCKRCNQSLSISEFYLRRNGRGVTPYCKKCTNEQAVERQQTMKRQAVEYKGGRCEICGYNRYIGALDFHHVNPDEKAFIIAFAKSTTFEKIRPELDKCQLVCANCHRELHAEQKGLFQCT